VFGGCWDYAEISVGLGTNLGGESCVFLLEEDFEKMEHVIGGKFKLGRKIGSGSFGELYLGNCFCYHSCGFCCCCRFVFFTTLCSLFWWQVSMCNLGRKWQLSWYVIYSFQGIYALLWVFTFQFSFLWPLYI